MDDSVSAPGEKLSQQSLAIEREKIQIEHEKLKVARDQVSATIRQLWLATTATGLSLLVAFGSVIISVRSLSQQAQLQARQAKDQFELKAAELVVSDNDPNMAYSRAITIQQLFPGRLKENWAARFKPEEYCHATYTDIIGFLNFVVAHPEQRQELARLWVRLHCDEDKSDFTQWMLNPKTLKLKTATLPSGEP
jgi:hypothetical protein